MVRQPRSIPSRLPLHRSLLSVDGFGFLRVSSSRRVNLVALFSFSSSLLFLYLNPPLSSTYLLSSRYRSFYRLSIDLLLVNHLPSNGSRNLLSPLRLARRFFARLLLAPQLQQSFLPLSFFSFCRSYQAMSNKSGSTSQGLKKARSLQELHLRRLPFFLLLSLGPFTDPNFSFPYNRLPKHLLLLLPRRRLLRQPNPTLPPPRGSLQPVSSAEDTTATRMLREEGRRRRASNCSRFQLVSQELKGSDRRVASSPSFPSFFPHQSFVSPSPPGSVHFTPTLSILVSFLSSQSLDDFLGKHVALDALSFWSLLLVFFCDLSAAEVHSPPFYTHSRSYPRSLSVYTSLVSFVPSLQSKGGTVVFPLLSARTHTTGLFSSSENKSMLSGSRDKIFADIEVSPK